MLFHSFLELERVDLRIESLQAQAQPKLKKAVGNHGLIRFVVRLSVFTRHMKSRLKKFVPHALEARHTSLRCISKLSVADWFVGEASGNSSAMGTGKVKGQGYARISNTIWIYLGILMALLNIC
eukprot:TRINITY_DN1780_c0_g3_i1.p1 TRINITY_DN1780_c0_g3~~TRINITY_DN1780_c0_g3_i1.p1  ORF type:complete len:124 (+),score=10.13 TRINITY_DN1780_c0_g3_i1:166-537(+)